MSELQINGRITFIGNAETISDKFSKRIFVLDVVDGQYTKKVCMQFVNDKMSKLDNLPLNTEVLVKFNLESREHGGKWYTNATAWYLSKENAGIPDASQSNIPNTEVDTSLPF